MAEKKTKAKAKLKKKTVSKKDASKDNGRPKIVFDIAQIHVFGSMKATFDTMADFYGVSVDTIRRRMQNEESDFCKAYKKGFSKLKMRLSEKQIQVALLGNPTMLIWLGKQYLEQKDQIEQELKQHISFMIDKDDAQA